MKPHPPSHRWLRPSQTNCDDPGTAAHPGYLKPERLIIDDLGLKDLPANSSVILPKPHLPRHQPKKDESSHNHPKARVCAPL